ncbi:hypothetical protein, partial [Escherichia coli]|uniref:hypothetical protein n=1 Tax=Escherichia coli TaxID=562 RepID=UPI00159BDED2
LTLAMITLAARGAPMTAAGVGISAVIVTFLVHRAATRTEVRTALLRRQFESGTLVTLAEATSLLDVVEREGPLDDAFLRKLLD